MADELRLDAEQLEAMRADAEQLLALLVDEEAEGEVEAGQLLLEWVPSVCDELTEARETIERYRHALEYYADYALWEKLYVGGGFTDSEAQEDMGLVARTALRGS